MTAPREPTLAPAWTIRAELAVDLDQVHELHRDAFGRASEAELVDAIRRSPFHVGEGSLVAVTADGSVLGHVLLSGATLLPADGGPAIPILALAPLAVAPAHQSVGIGAALMRAAMAVADTRPEPMTVVVGAPDYYARFGFAPASSRGVSGPYAAAGDAFAVRARSDIAKLPSGIVVYPPAFGLVDD